ncbi:hypothetical protein O6H91_23G039500 [Diphasiastrum complanatum]|uniref:Uncharacterized protein n=1 Tax=Diphasiastrum complanatum TaxID=34168 RepID=A0ACC2A9T8_DIPCM|nr:hypothetical protein O6H91_23G039500 [Diphasiastrum complanatum]
MAIQQSTVNNLLLSLMLLIIIATLNTVVVDANIVADSSRTRHSTSSFMELIPGTLKIAISRDSRQPHHKHLERHQLKQGEHCGNRICDAEFPYCCFRYLGRDVCAQIEGKC